MRIKSSPEWARLAITLLPQQN